MSTVEDVNNRIVVCGEWVLPKMMGKIDVLSPILFLEGREEEFVLDLHYSLSRKRVWNATEVHSISTKILEKLSENSEDVHQEICQRFELTDGSDIFNDWIRGLQDLAHLTCQDPEIFWERIHMDQKYHLSSQHL